MTEKEEVMTIEQVRKAAIEMGYEEGDDTIVLLLSAMVVGPNQRRLARFTGLDRDWIRERAERLRENGIWVQGRIYMEEPGDVIEIALHHGVAEGMIEVV